MAASEYYQHGTFPSTGAFGSSSAMRAELESIETGISAKLPDLSGNGSKIIAVNSGATALEAITTTGTGSGVRATSPTLTSPRIDTGLGLGAAAATGTGILNELTITGGVTAYGIQNNGVIQSDVTTSAHYYRTSAATAAAAFTLNQLFHFNATQGTFGAGSTVSLQIGFYAGSSLTGGNANYGFRHDIAAAAGAWGFYGFGTAANHFTGATTFGAKFGYGTTGGVGGTVTQATSKSTAVTLNTPSGEITMNNAALAAATIVSFTLNNSSIAANDQVVVTHDSAGTLGAYTVNGRATGAGTAEINVRNNTAGSLSEAIVLKFSVLAGAVA